jgi:hypothetical protein
VLEHRSQIFGSSGRQVVDDGDLVAAVQEVLDQMAADEPCPTRHCCLHDAFRPLNLCPIVATSMEIAVVIDGDRTPACTLDALTAF